MVRRGRHEAIDCRSRAGCGSLRTGTMSRLVFLCLGSNLGPREATLARALETLGAQGLRMDQASALYLTEPVDGPPQDWYVNQVVAGETTLSPDELLEAARATEKACGRVRGERNAARTLDIDILLYGDLIRDSPELTLPHPRLHERRFVLVPLCEIAPDLVHPRLGLRIRELLARCPDTARVLPHVPEGAAR